MGVVANAGAAVSDGGLTELICFISAFLSLVVAFQVASRAGYGLGPEQNGLVGELQNCSERA